MSLLILSRRRFPRGEGEVAPPLPPTSLIGVGSYSDSYTSHPPTPTTTSGHYYVSTSGSNDNDGSFSAPFRTISYALGQVSAGQTILVRAGTYNEAISRSSRTWAATVRVMGYGDEIPVINAGGASIGLGFNNVTNELWAGFRIINAVDYGTRVFLSSNIRLERMYVHDCATNQFGVGIMLNRSTNCTVMDCAVWGLGTPGMTGTNTPDCFTATASSGNTSEDNSFIRCFAANGTDDNFDLFRANNTLILDSVALSGGYFYNGSTSSSEGNGFKMGSGAVSNNTQRGGIALYNRNNGFNSNSASYISYDKSTSANNNVGVRFFLNGATGYAEETIILGNNTDIHGDQYQVIPPPERLVRNSWQLGVNASNVRFADPTIGDFSLLPNSEAVGKGLGGGNLGASTIALELLKKWWNHSGIWVPGRGNGPGGTGLPGDTP